MFDTFDIARSRESALAMNQSHDALRGHIRTALATAHDVAADSWSSDTPWVTDVFPSHVVYSHKGQLHKRSYSVDYGAAGSVPKVSVGKAQAVHAGYMTSATKMDEADRDRSFLVNLPEAEATPESETPEGTELVCEGITFSEDVTVKESKTQNIEVKIIAPGWGSMAYYPKEVLQRDGPKVFTKGTHMMWNHATSTEEADRPEGNLDNLAAVLTTDAQWKESGAKGAGLYARAKVFSDYAEQVAEKGAHIGVSINAAIRGKEGTRDGRTGRIAEQFVKAYSTDFVTRAGAGGAPVVPVTEASRGPQEQPIMTDEERTQLDNATKENATLKARLAQVEESQNRVLATNTVAAVLKEAGVPFSRKLLERACAAPTFKEGQPDADWVKSVVMDFSEGQEGRIQGFGGDGSEVPAREAEQVAKNTDARLREAFKSLGMADKGLDFAVAGRV